MHSLHVPDLTARQLHAVLSIAEYGSFVAAAAFLNTSQPALTRTIRRVEDVLGVRLFERSTRRVAMTAAGREFVALAERMLNDLRIGVRSMREIGQQQRGQVIVSSIMSVANTFLPQMILSYRSRRPGVEIQVREGVHGSVLEDVRSGVADLGITYVDDVPEFVRPTRLNREVFKVVVPRGHSLARMRAARSVRFADVAMFPLVSLPSDSRTRRLIDGAAAAAGQDLQHVVTVTQFATMMSFVRAGVGLAIVPSGALAGNHGEELVVLALTKPQLRRDLGMIMLRGREPTPAASGFASAVLETWPTLMRGAQ
jgi:DNA-binding transcriptional LysR family regulator